MDIELEKLKKLEHALCDAMDILRDWQVEEVKPEQERFIVYLARPKYRDCYLTACAEGMWEAAQKEFDAKTKLFVGTCDEAVKWYQLRYKFKDLIKAWEDRKEIQFYDGTVWCDVLYGKPLWNPADKYRVKPECPCEDGIDSKACAGCEHSEDGKRKYKPYVTVEEFIQDYQERFPTAVTRPAHTMPLIWVKTKSADAKFLVTGFIPDSDDGDYVEVHGYNCNMDDLLEYYVYLDGSPCGKEC